MAGQDDNISNLLSSIAATSAPSAQNEAGRTTSAHSTQQTSDNDDQNTWPSSTGGESGSVQWGPAITASPLASPVASNHHNDTNGNSQTSDSGLSESAKKVITCTTTIGGTFILALLIYALWRRRKGASYSEIVRFRPHSSTAVLSPMSEDEHLTALPIYRQERISIRSSRHDSQMDLAQQGKKMPTVPSALRREWRVDEPADKTPSQPKTPTQQQGRTFLTDATPPSKHLIEEPERAHTLNRVSTLSLPLMRHSVQSRPPQAENTIQEQLPASMSPPHSPDFHLDLHHRWSWTNSQAPSTPRIQPPTRTSLTSLRLGSVAAWVKSQRHDDEDEDEEPHQGQRQAHTRGLSRPLLKNQAIRPVLAPAPPPAKKLSKRRKHGRVGSLSSIFKPHPHSAVILSPLSPRLEEREGTSIEMVKQKS